MIISYRDKRPSLGKGCFVAANATLIGRVLLGEDSSVFFNSVLRGDINEITIGKKTNIQDNCVLHVSDEYGISIGEEVVVGHSCTLHACTLGNRALVGMGSIVLDGCLVGDECLIAAGSLLPMGKNYPSGHLLMGRPAAAVRLLDNDEKKYICHLAEKYIGVKNQYLSSAQ